MTFFVTHQLNKQLGQVPARMFPGESASPRDPFISPLCVGLARPKPGP